MPLVSDPFERNGVDGSARPPLLSMRGVTKRYPGVLANDRVDLDVHSGEIVGLLGENGAGKTTLMKVLFGLERADEGSIEIDGAPVTIDGPRDALELGIGMVHQHFMLVPDMTIAENVALGMTRGPRTGLPEVRAQVRQLSEQFGLELDPDACIADIPVGTQQRVEIVKLLCRGARLLILDEPTASIGPREWDRLAEILAALARDGAGVVFITHKLAELDSVVDRVVVLRDGRVIGETTPGASTPRELARMMVGRDVVLRVAPTPCTPGPVVASVRELALVDGRGRLRLDDISFDVRAGEILGVAGVEGNGQAELVQALVGLTIPTSGTVTVDGRPLTHRDPTRFAAAGGALVPEDRHRDGVALDLSLLDNIVLRDHAHAPCARYGFLTSRGMRTLATDLAARYDVRTPSLDVTMRQLSGGNQQKAVLARELHGQPRFLVAAQPTRGLDVGAMEAVYEEILRHRDRGGATLLFSHDLEEVVSLSDRVAVLSRGRIVRILEGGEVDLETLGLLMAGEDDLGEPVGAIEDLP